MARERLAECQARLDEAHEERAKLLNQVPEMQQELQDERVAVVPGNAFGASGEGYVRACYASSYEQIERALERMGRFVMRYR